MLADSCRQNLHALMIGATPAYYVPGAFDGGVQGIVLSLQLPGKTEPDRFEPGQYPGGNTAAIDLVRTDEGRSPGRLQQSGVKPAEIAGAAPGPYHRLGRRHARLAGVAAVARRRSSPSQRFSWSSRVAGRWPGTRRRGPKIYCARPSTGCGRQRSCRGDRCSVWQSFPPSIGSR